VKFGTEVDYKSACFEDLIIVTVLYYYCSILYYQCARKTTIQPRKADSTEKVKNTSSNKLQTQTHTKRLSEQITSEVLVK
jgi:hypothetical protein